MNSMLTRDISAIRELLDSYALSTESQEMLDNELLTGDPFNVDIEFPKTKSKASRVNDELLYGLGLELVHDDDDDNFYIDEDYLDDEDDE